MKKEELNDKINELTKKRAECLKEYGGEANIPLTSSYWDDGNQVRALLNELTLHAQVPQTPDKRAVVT